jgi:hypothetical protein
MKQLILALLFVGFLLLNAGALFTVYRSGGMYSDDLSNLILKLGLAYLIPLAVIAGGSLGTPRARKQAP